MQLTDLDISESPSSTLVLFLSDFGNANLFLAQDLSPFLMASFLGELSCLVSSNKEKLETRMNEFRVLLDDIREMELHLETPHEKKINLIGLNIKDFDKVLL